jgi:lipoate-protein ligase A
MEVARPALALGSTQPPSHVDADRAARAGVEVVRRRSGGGAVLVGPGGPLWIDVLVPRGDPRWDDDVGRAAWWVGEAWCRALAALGAPSAALAVHRGALQRSTWSDRICFAAVGAGEVTAGGRKVVGVSQRRTRHGARLQCAALLRWEPAPLVDLLALDPAERAACRAAVAGVAVGVADLARDAGRGANGHSSLRERLVAAFLAELPAA